MIIAIHVVIALLSIACATLGYIRPANKNLQMNYALVALTFISGFYLVLSEPAQILHTCLSGLVYLAVVTVGILLARKKLTLIQTASN